MKTIRELYEAFKFWFIIAVVVGILYCIISDSPYLKMQRGRWNYITITMKITMLWRMGLGPNS